MKAKRLISLLLVMVVVFFMTTTAFAASSSKTFTSSSGTIGSMSLYLDPGESGSSSIATINVSGLPADAVITKVVADCNTMSYSGAILSNRLYITTSNISGWTSAPWGSGNKTEISAGLIGTLANGTYQLYYTGTNVSSLSPGYKTYKNIKLTVYYNY
ncbi:hypothetical protein NSS70_18225 [Aeribacillus sp. FSL K6-2848]|jgi:hypothetical protein|uniref:DUF4879 domain-containing protein n=1 Tax=Aeribacillus pallidus TaxID=33936 RepID=A0A223E1A0_9BACI|nr:MULTISPECIES: hypothetical protein [Aeribacillus]ASS89032.1 hypothetical protein AP3564_01020 [Aeribacillus pallidus]MDR9792405.1 hypothetical protein [Aeribacillus pallidus]MDR9798140.1 hypothetical protein [Aeribacillus pallidus]TVZ77693.1 hypothetical protein FB379_13140 [Aeribacillus composti]